MGKDPMNKSLNELENNKVSEVSCFDSYVVQRSYELFETKLKDYTLEDYRFMIGQNFGLKYLIPLAVEVLNKEPLLKAKLYEGDLLLTVLRTEKLFWRNHPELRQSIIHLFTNGLIDYTVLKDSIKSKIWNAFEEFTQ